MYQLGYLTRVKYHEFSFRKVVKIHERPDSIHQTSFLNCHKSALSSQL